VPSNGHPYSDPQTPFWTFGLGMKAAETGVGQIIIGIDYPFPWNRVPVDHVLSIPGLSDDDKIAILGGTAAKLLGIKA
jgi:hypothetical protein